MTAQHHLLGQLTADDLLLLSRIRNEIASESWFPQSAEHLAALESTIEFFYRRGVVFPDKLRELATIKVKSQMVKGRPLNEA